MSIRVYCKCKFTTILLINFTTKILLLASPKDMIPFQGLNRLAAIALLFLNEEDAFWCLVCIVEYIMPQDYYTTTLMAAQVDQVSVW